MNLFFLFLDPIRIPFGHPSKCLMYLKWPQCPIRTPRHVYECLFLPLPPYASLISCKTSTPILRRRKTKSGPLSLSLCQTTKSRRRSPRNDKRRKHANANANAKSGVQLRVRGRGLCFPHAAWGPDCASRTYTHEGRRYASESWAPSYRAAQSIRAVTTPQRSIRLPLRRRAFPETKKQPRPRSGAIAPDKAVCRACAACEMMLRLPSRGRRGTGVAQRPG